jgi:chromosomal replication initiator protein
MADSSSVWKDALTELLSELPRQQIEDWISPLRPIGIEDGTLVLGANSELQRAYLSKNCQTAIELVLERVAGEPLKARFELDMAGQQLLMGRPHEAPEIRVPRPRNIGGETGLPLNPRYVFDSFVVGNSNRFAHAAAQGAAEKPGASHNPLFLYGGVGLGKTHLLQAVGHAVKAKWPGKRVLYTTSEKFANDMIKTLQDKNMREFRRKYRNVDLLLIDDIQFFQGRESTQEEFFHTFNDLVGAQRQIVATSDTHPKDIRLEDRLKSRCQGGLVADLQAPDIETRIAILRKRAETEGLSIPAEVHEMIAESVVSNIRELEGALNRVVAFATMTGQPVGLEQARESLRDLITYSRPALSPARIQAAVARRFSLDPTILSDRTRTDAVAYPRQLAMYLCRELLSSSYDAIGAHFGGRDHTTALYSIDKISRLKDSDAQTATHLQEVRKFLNA